MARVPAGIDRDACPEQISSNSPAGQRRSKAMASRNLVLVIRQAVSDAAFRRKLQSDPAAALRGFNLTPDEIAALRSGDSGKLMSLGIDQRMSKAFSAGGAMAGGAARQSVSDLTAGGTASTIANDPTAGTREGIIGDPSGSRGGLADPTVAGTRAVNDSEPFVGNIVINDNLAAANAGRGGSLAGDMSVSSHMAGVDDAASIRAVNDVAPFDSGVNTVASSEVIPTDELRAMEHQSGGDTSTIVPGSTGSETGNEHGWG
jgi:hypothetical protein